MSSEARPCSLYRLYDAAGDLLYVGISGTALARLNQHAHDKSWWPEIADVCIVHYANRSEATAAELHAIRSESPRFNIAGKHSADRTVRQMLETAWSTDCRVPVLRAIAEQVKPITQRELIELLGPDRPWGSVVRALHYLVQDHRIQKVGEGTKDQPFRYLPAELPDKAYEAMEALLRTDPGSWSDDA